MPETDFHLPQNQSELFLTKKKLEEGEGGGDSGCTRRSPDVARCRSSKEGRMGQELLRTNNDNLKCLSAFT